MADGDHRSVGTTRSNDVDRGRFRDAMSLLPAGVTVVTADDGWRLHGVTVSSFTSVSLEPPLLLVCVKNDSALPPIARSAEAFAVHILAGDQEDVAMRFATAAPEERAAAMTRLSRRPPDVPGALVRFECRLAAEHPGGDHAILIGEVTSLRIEETDAPSALNWWRRRFSALQTP